MYPCCLQIKTRLHFSRRLRSVATSLSLRQSVSARSRRATPRFEQRTLLPHTRTGADQNAVQRATPHRVTLTPNAHRVPHAAMLTAGSQPRATSLGGMYQLHTRAHPTAADTAAHARSIPTLPRTSVEILSFSAPDFKLELKKRRISTLSVSVEIHLFFAPDFKSELKKR